MYSDVRAGVQAVPRKHNYYQKLIQLYEEGKAPPGRITDMDVYHDDWCHIYRSAYCNCDPEVKLRPPAEWS